MEPSSFNKMNMQETEQDEKIGAVLVCGAGIAGIQASLDLANGGFKVYLLEPTAAIGGRMAQLDKTYTSGDCASCILSPKLVECARNRNIEIITLADVESVSGNPGNFKVKIRQNPRYIDLKKCDACGDCEQVCPVTLPSEFDCGMGNRKAAFRPYPQAIPNVFSISKSTGQAPCRALCPAGVNVPGFAALTAAGKLEEAYSLIRQRCPLPAVSGRICHHPCESKCNRGEVDEAVASCDLERFIADYVYENPGRYPAFPQPAVLLDRKVAVIGGGPAGLTAAADLAMLGYRVTIFEARAHLGGMLRYGIPAYRLPKDVLDREIQNILQLGIEVRTGVSIAKPADLLISGTRAGSAQGGFDAVFVATGAWVGRKPGIPGDNALGVWEGLHFLQEFNDGKVHTIGSSVLVIGSSDLALEAARCARRVPGVNSVEVVGLESSGELKADPRLVAEVVQDGVNFRYSLGPTGIDAEPGKAISVAFRACTSVYNKYKRFDPLFDDSVTSTIVADTVIVSGGRGVDSVRFGLETRPGGRIVADKDSLATSVKGIFAGGDAVLGSASMVDAVAQGHRAAESIEAYIRGTVAIRRTAVSRTSASVPQSSGTVAFAPNPRAESKLKEKGSSFEPRAEKISGLDQATAEARRCLNCGLCSECMLCVEACSAGAILHDQQPTELEIEVGSIILAPGFEEAQESFKEGLGRERYANVISSLQFERILSLSEPSGQLPRPSDGLDAKRIAFIQCVGSRNETHDYCSSVCCMNAAKEALDALERTGGGVREAWIFGKEIRPVGKESDAYINRAREEHGVHFVRTASSHVREIAENRNLKITYSADGKDLEQEFDLVVLSKGLQVSESVKQMAGRLGVQLNPFGFAQTQRFSPLAASTPGIYLAGAFQEPKDIPESVAQASGAAACAMSLLTTVRGTLTRRREYPWERDVYDEPARIGVFVCHCGHNIASVVDVEWVARKAAKMPNVCYAEATMYTCSDSNQQHIRDLIRKHRLNRLVVASCSSRTHEMLFQETLRESGLNQYLFSMTNIRDQCSWVHRDNPAAATAKALDLVSMAVARARYLKAFPLIELEVAPSALVLGGGLAGMTAALGIADQGYKVHLVEREPALGGLLRTMYRTLEQEDVQAKLEELTAKTRSHPNISVYLNSNLVRTSGQVGDFTSVVDVAGEEKTLKHGAVIVATGGIAKTTSRYLHGSNPHVITQVALESALGKDDLPEELRGRKDPAVVMIQCVESRDEKTPYCSRVCCSEAIKNALEIMRRLPDSRIVILNRDIRTDGFRDMYFRKARQEGIQFITFPDGGPEVAEDNGRITVKTRDMDAGNEVTLQPDLLVLSTGISPAAGNAALSGMLRSALTSDGFFMEAHSRLRPVDLSNEGEFLCGLAHSPRFMDETIAQALAAAGRASRILSKSLLEVAGQVSYVNPAECVACATCVKVCPYGAPVINAIGKSEIQGAKCMGCGSCVSACPAKAIALQHQESRTVMAMLDEMLAGGGF
jgi:heterodisulfide reductase subunit A-like polyferredoxin